MNKAFGSAKTWACYRVLQQDYGTLRMDYKKKGVSHNPCDSSSHRKHPVKSGLLLVQLLIKHLNSSCHGVCVETKFFLHMQSLMPRCSPKN